MLGSGVGDVGVDRGEFLMDAQMHCLQYSMVVLIFSVREHVTTAWNRVLCSVAVSMVTCTRTTCAIQRNDQPRVEAALKTLSVRQAHCGTPHSGAR